LFRSRITSLQDQESLVTCRERTQTTKSLLANKKLKNEAAAKDKGVTHVAQFFSSDSANGVMTCG